MGAVKQAIALLSCVCFILIWRKRIEKESHNRPVKSCENSIARPALGRQMIVMTGSSFFVGSTFQVGRLSAL